MSARATATIDLSALRHNYLQAKQRAPQAKAIAVIKANGYGHGLIEVAEALADSDALAVARLSEAEAIRNHGIETRTLILSDDLGVDELAFCAARRLDVVLHSPQTVERLLAADLPQPLNAWFKVDSGMHRLGLDRERLPTAVRSLLDSGKVAEHFYLTHLHSADEADAAPSSQQLQYFQSALRDLPAAPLSVANSAAILRGIDNTADWIRPGIMLYGANPLATELLAEHPVDLRAVMTLTAPILAIREIAAGETVGYNRRFSAGRKSIIATAAIGYGDGYPRHAANATPVMIGTQPAQLAGTVSMDMIGIDISDCQGVQVGDEVTLWGQSLPAEDIARHAGTIPYQLFTSVTSRVRKVYRR